MGRKLFPVRAANRAILPVLWRTPYSKPLFTLRQSPLCNSRDDLQTLLSVLRSGQKELFDRVQGCIMSPVDGVPVVVLDREGLLDVWMRVRLMLPTGNQPRRQSL